MPFASARDRHYLAHTRSRRQARSLDSGQVASDYNQDGEHLLHTGAWDWHSYIIKVGGGGEKGRE